MKRKEKQHLKKDPLAIFVEKVMTAFVKYKKELIITAAIAGVLLLVILAVWTITGLQVSKENDMVSQAIEIRKSPSLNIDEKIDQLNKLQAKRGISAIIPLYTAALYFEKGELEKSQEALKGFSESKIRVINDEKRILEADILTAQGKSKDALDILNILVSDPATEIAPDLILLKMAKIQLKNNQKQDAVQNLKRITKEFADSFYSAEARTLLEDLDEAPTGSDLPSNT